MLSPSQNIRNDKLSFVTIVDVRSVLAPTNRISRQFLRVFLRPFLGTRLTLREGRVSSNSMPYCKTRLRCNSSPSSLTLIPTNLWNYYGGARS